MPDKKFSSTIGSQIEAFIQQKRAVGYPYHTSEQILLRFDRMIAEKFQQETTITKSMYSAWIEASPAEHPNSLQRRLTPVRQLGKYMNGLGKGAYILPGHIPHKQIKYEAHVYTQNELKAFFNAIDQCPPSPFSPTRQYVIPVIFRVLYCCGLRPSEARCLEMRDIDLKTGKIQIRESKGWKERIVYMSQDLLEVCQDYNAIVKKMLPGRRAFFPNKNGGCFSISTLCCWFHEFWDRLPEANVAKGSSPRVNDFRHVYAVDRLNRWITEEEDINALCLYLSEYMGHCRYAHTDYYLSLVTSFYPEMERRLSDVNEDILPEVHDEEE